MIRTPILVLVLSTPLSICGDCISPINFEARIRSFWYLSLN